MWFKYKTIFNDDELVLCEKDDGTVISGHPDSLPEYQAWLADGNTPGEWTPKEVD